jgi:hypothetical protein
MNTKVVIDVMKVLRKEFQHEDENGKFDPMIEVDILTLAQAAQTILETTSNFVIDSPAEKLRVRISNLEAQNDGLRENNRALAASNETLREALDKMANPVIHINNSGPIVRAHPVVEKPPAPNPPPPKMCDSLR